MNAVSHPGQANGNNQRSSPNSTENNTNLNNNQVMAVKRGPRTKLTPMRPQPLHNDEDGNANAHANKNGNTIGYTNGNGSGTINISLSRYGMDEAELTLMTSAQSKISYDTLLPKQKDEVQKSLLRDNVWQKMLNCLRNLRPTNDTLELFRKILPNPQREHFFTELEKVYVKRNG